MILNFSNKRKGMSLIEALIALGVASIIFLSGMSLFNVLSLSKAEVEKRKFVKDIMLENLIEVKGIPLEGLPGVNQCKIRSYRMDGVFLSDSVVNDVTSNCGITSFVKDTIYIFLKIFPSSVINTTFIPANFLKLSTFSDTVFQIEIKSFLVNSVNNQEFKNEIVFFKK